MKTQTHERALHMLNKVPEVTVYFWVIKIMCTTVGETAADFLNMDLHFGLAATSVVTSVLLLIFMVMQLRSKKYVPWLYWWVVVLISTVGTLITDNLVDNFGIALQTTTIVFSLALAASLGAWYFSEKTLSIHAILTKKRELFYWATILFTFALGTAAGDLVAEGLGLGYANSVVMFASMIAVVMIGYYGFRLNAIGAFWAAYILTRPLGASLGDYLMQPHANGGLGFGAGFTNALFLLGIVSLVLYMTVKQHKVRQSHE
jgi:uncharacterized membrane-anchored protein